MLKGLSINHYGLFFLIALLSINLSFAAVLDKNNATEDNISLISANKLNIIRAIHPVFTFTAGASISHLGQSQSFAPLDLCRYNYKPQGTKTNILWGGFIGSELRRSSAWGLMIGLGYYQPGTLSTTGTLIQGADSESDTAYSYKYQTQSQQLLAEGKLYWIAKERIQAFLMVGMGAAFNKVSNYQTTVPPFFEFTPAFSNHTQSKFTYAFGPGIDLSLAKSFRVGVGYRFTDLGAANTGGAQIDAIPIASTLKQSHLYANQIFAQFTYIPGTQS